jgi:hypothetical protein
LLQKLFLQTQHLPVSNEYFLAKALSAAIYNIGYISHFNQFALFFREEEEIIESCSITSTRKSNRFASLQMGLAIKDGDYNYYYDDDSDSDSDLSDTSDD